MLPAPAVHHLPPQPPAPVHAPPEPMLLTPTDNDIGLPPPAAAGDSSLTFALPVPTAAPSSFTLANPAADASVPDIGTLFPTADPPSSFTLGGSVPAAPAAPDSGDSYALPAPPALSDHSTPDLSGLFPAAQVSAAPDSADSFAGSSALADLDLPMAEPGSSVTSGAGAYTGTPTPDLDSVLGATDPNDAVAPASGWLHPHAPAPADAPPAAPPAPTGRSSYEFTLPDGVKSYSDMPPVQQPEPEDLNAAHAAPLPPRPAVTRMPGTSYDMFNLSDAEVALPPEPARRPRRRRCSPPPRASSTCPRPTRTRRWATWNRSIRSRRRPGGSTRT